MTPSIVLTVIGPDRPGLVEALADTLSDHDANWLESRMAHLAGQFAGLLRVEAPAERHEALRKALTALEHTGLRVLIETAEAGAPAPPSVAHHLDLVGQDQPGIIREISRALAVRGVNVEALETEVTSAPMSGESLFHARAELRLPAGAAVDELRDELEKIAGELMVDLSLGDGD